MVGKLRKSSTKRVKVIPPYLKEILPLIVLVQDFKLYSPETLLQRIAEATKPEVKHSPQIVKEINKYLRYYGYATLGDPHARRRISEPVKKARKQKSSGV